ncbi:hypothetical protein O181_002198 [Austropuccinia psidii MF-1]|uniref:Deoxycytidylate deaminase n=1 Tax=Austropuccinia psidii MF-1 TaxID=1389203 RepID=A0A9Q3BC07_9BASI|nr:hypothetical protein [Austropuccinia psidii MF-1]
MYRVSADNPRDLLELVYPAPRGEAESLDASGQLIAHNNDKEANLFLGSFIRDAFYPQVHRFVSWLGILRRIQEGGMLIALVGAQATGKRTIVEFLIKTHFFTRVSIAQSSDSDSDSDLVSSAHLRFATAEELLNFATSNWTHDLVTTDLRSEASIKPFSKRPWVAFVFVQSRLIDRWKRKFSLSSANNITLEEFIIEDDIAHFGNRPDQEPLSSSDSVLSISRGLNGCKLYDSTPLNALMPYVTYSFNNDLSVSDLLRSITRIHLPNIRASIRPTWDSYFISLSDLASLRSNCMKRRVGAVLVTSDNRVLSTGYNGTPRGMKNCNEGGCRRCNGGNYSSTQLSTSSVPACGMNLEECLCLHAEENALLEAGRDRITNSTLYCNTCPCLRCSVKIVQCGVKEVVYSQSYSMDLATTQIFLEAGVKLRQIDSTFKVSAHACSQ